ncbi:MAG: VCBS repeat-containing protein [Planctomycetota bacterium]
MPATCTSPASLALLLAAPLAAQEPPLFPDAQYPAGGQPFAVALAHLDGDGKLDALTVENLVPGAVQVYLGDGVGRFTAGPSFAVGDGPESVATADIDGDGWTDVITPNRDSGDVSLLLGDGGGGFAPAVQLPVGDEPRAVVAADLNGDGALDLVVATRFGSDGAVSVLLGDGLGGFGPPATFPTTGATPEFLAVGQLDGDGALDVVGAANLSTFVFLGDGAGGLALQPTLPSGWYHQALALGDVNEDAATDLVSFGGLFGDSAVVVRLGDGLGGFAAEAVYPAASALASHGILADLDADGHLDAALTDYGEVSLLFGDGSGAFGAPVSTVGESTQEWVAAGDLDADGDLDLVTANRNENTISVHLAAGPGAYTSPTATGASVLTLAVGDVNADGDVDGVAVSFGELRVLPGDGAGGFGLGATATGTGASGLRLADLDGDGRHDAVASSTAEDAVRTWVGDGAGGFADVGAFAVGVDPHDVALGDLNLDGALDAVAACSEETPFGSSSSEISVLLGDGAGGFRPAETVDAPGSAVAVAIADADADGVADVALATSFGLSVELYLGDGSGSLPAASTSLATGGAPTALAFADVHGDGQRDLVVGASFAFFAGTGPALEVFAGDGAGGFAGPAAYPLAGSTNRLALSDYDGDGALDALVATTAATNVLLGDGAGGFQAGLLFTTGNNPAAADVDADGRMDVMSGYGGLLVSRNQRPAPIGQAPFGDGTPGCLGRQALLANGPAQVGAVDFGFALTGAPAASAGFVAVANAADAVGADPLGLGAVLHLDLAATTLFHVFAVESNVGGAGFLPLPLPPSPALGGLTVFAQALWSWPGDAACDPSALLLSSSRGLEVGILP